LIRLNYQRFTHVQRLTQVWLSCSSKGLGVKTKIKIHTVLIIMLLAKPFYSP
jgi:hypothetical protein